MDVMKCRSFIIKVLVLATLALNNGSAVLAQESKPFETTLQTTYDISESGATKVTHSFAVKNLLPTVYLQDYTLSTGFRDLTGVTVTSGNQTVTPQVTKESTKTIIKVPFTDQVVGQNKVRQFQVEYVISNMAVVAGQVLEVQLPPLTSPDPYKQHTVTVKSPLKFGRAVRVKPEPVSIGIEDQQILTTFDQTTPQAISAFYGDRQMYSMTLRYNLENNSSSQGIAQIALPPDTAFQRLHIHSLDPPPEELKRDDDGNWLASYTLPPNTTSAVYLIADVLITLDPNPDFPTLMPLKEHTEEKKFWEVHNNQIKQIVSEKSDLEQAYQYVIDSLQYSYEILNDAGINRRLGAVEALQKPNQAVCQEFTDLFITLARAQGVPARRLTGYAYTQNRDLRPLSLESDVLHAWPEYFDQDKGIWRQVDPTWQSTTGGVDYFSQFDLSHVVFAINGKSSTTPYPAGSYKGTDLSSKDVEVSFGSTFPKIEPTLTIQAVPTKTGGLTIPGKYTIGILNTTGQAWYDVSVKLESPDPSGVLLSQAEFTIPALLPYQHVKVPLTIVSTHWKPGESIEVPYNFSVLKRENANNSGRLSVSTGPAIIKYANSQNVFIALGVSCAICVLGAWGILVFRQKRKRFVRR